MKRTVNKKIKIAFINYSLDIGGIETLILNICKQINRDIFEASIFVFTKNGTLKEEYINSGVGVIEVGKKDGFDWFLPVRLSRALKKNMINIVHTHNSSNWLYGAIAGKIAGIPVIHTEHTTRNSYSKHAIRWALIENVLAKFTKTIISVAESIKNQMSIFANIDPRKIKIIHNGIEYDKFDRTIDKEKIKRSLSLAKDDIVIGNVARFYDNKDHKTLLKAFKLVLGKVQNTYLLLIGDGPLKKEAEDVAKDLQLEKKVKFIGNRRDIPAILKIMDVFALSSKKEGLPIVLLEAMASGLPVVATNVDGNAEAVQHGKTGIIVPAKDHNLLAEAIISVLIDKEQAKQMGKKGQERVRQYFSFKKMIKKYEDIYISAINKRRKICIAGEFPPLLGGMALQAQLLVERLNKEGYTVGALKRNTNIYFCENVKFFRSFLRFLIYVKNLFISLFRTDVYHVFSNSHIDFFLYTVPVIIVGKLLGKRVIINYRGGAADVFFKKYLFFIKPVLMLADDIIVPSKFLQNIFGKFGIKARIIPNICDLEKFKFKEREELSPVFIISRHLEKKYNISCAIKAFKIVKDAYPHAMLKIAGDGPDEPNIRKIIKELKLSASVELLGRVENHLLPSIHNNTDIFLNSSNVDNMPIAVLEAFASGLIVVSTNAGGLKYLIEDRKTGFLVDVNDHVEMANRVFEVLKNPSLTKQMVYRARELAQSCSWENVKHKWLEAYS